MGVCARDDLKNTTMVGIKADKPKNKRDNDDQHDDNDHDVTASSVTVQNKKMKLPDQIKEDRIEQQESMSIEAGSKGDDEEEGVEGDDGLEPIGDVVRVSESGGEKRRHYKGFKFDDYEFFLEDTVLVTPDEGKDKASVAIIKDIFQPEGGYLMVTGQRLYRPDEVKKQKGGTWQSHDSRELFYTRHLDEFNASSVMHKCVVHLVPVGKPLPNRKDQPGFIIQKVYEFEQQKLRVLNDKDCRGALSQI